MVLRVEGFLSCDSVKSDSFAILDQTVERVLSQRHRSRFITGFIRPGSWGRYILSSKFGSIGYVL